jgi:hypothetical protein
VIAQQPLGGAPISLTPAIEKTLRKTRHQIQPFAVGTDRPAVETGHDLTLPRPFKSETRLVTLCHSDGRPLLALTVVWKLSYAIEDGHLLIRREKCGLI